MRVLYLTILVLSCAYTVSAKKAVYDTLIYTHALHETKYDVGKCEVCHENIAGSKRARDDNYADDQSCAAEGCHDIKDQDSCFVCHTNADAETPEKPKREIKNNHKLHAENKIECKDCHSYIDDHTYFTRKEMVAMTVCTDCHAKEKIDNDCEYCHSDLTITMSHDGMTRNGHGELFNYDQQICDQCHTSSHCNGCHQGLVSRDVHPGNYLHTHRFDAFLNGNNCMTCHTNSSSCDGCHIKSWGKIINHQKIVDEQTSCKTCH